MNGKSGLVVCVFAAASLAFAWPANSAGLDGSEDEKVAHDLDPEKPFDVQSAADMQSILVMNGSSLKILDADGRRELKSLKLAKPYKKIREREEYYVALSNNSVDLLAKDTFEVRKSIELRCQSTRDLAIHPGLETSYAAVLNDDGGRRGKLSASRIVQINESSGTATELSRIYGSWISIDPTGRNLYVALRATYQQGVRIDWNIGQVLPDYGDIDILVRYEIRGRTLRHAESNLEAGTNGSHMVISPDGQHIAYVSGAGTPKFSYAIPAFKGDDIKVIPVSYKIGAYPRDISFHPMLDLVVASNGKEAVAFHRKTGEKIEDKLAAVKGRRRENLKRVYCTPSGTHVLVGYGEHYKGLVTLESVPLQLHEKDRATIAKGAAPAELRPRTELPDDEEQVTIDPAKPLPLERFQALAGQPAKREVTPKEIARYFTSAVVLVESEDGNGTGFVIGRDGFIITCAHVIPPIGDPWVSLQAEGSDKVEKLRAGIVRIDREVDLALLRIMPKSPLRTVQLKTTGKIEAGGEVTVIGNPGIGSTVLTNTVTTGVVSNPSRELDGFRYIQTSAATNPGNSGGPMFNSRGQVIGIVVAKARLENTGFAIPAESLLQFLRAGQNSDKASPAGGHARQWTDISGEFKVQAVLLGVKDGKARLKKLNGQVITVPVEKLSGQDRQYLSKSE